MKKKLWICGLLCMISILGYQIVKSKVFADEYDQPITFNLTAKDKFQLNLEVKEGGSILDGEARIRQGSVSFHLPIDSEKIFRVMPDKGYFIKHVWYQVPGYETVTDISNKMIENTLCVKCVSANANITVEFEKDKNYIDKDIPSKFPDKKPNTDSIPSVKTGDTRRIGLLILCIVVSGISCTTIYAKKKK